MDSGIVSSWEKTLVPKKAGVKTENWLYLKKTITPLLVDNAYFAPPPYKSIVYSDWRPLPVEISDSRRLWLKKYPRFLDFTISIPTITSSVDFLSTEFSLRCFQMQLLLSCNMCTPNEKIKNFNRAFHLFGFKIRIIVLSTKKNNILRRPTISVPTITPYFPFRRTKIIDQKVTQKAGPAWESTLYGCKPAPTTATRDMSLRRRLERAKSPWLERSIRRGLHRRKRPSRNPGHIS